MPENRFSQFMQGRLGSDELNQCVVLLATLFVFLNIFATTRILTILALLLLVIAAVRAFMPAGGINETLNAAFLNLFNGTGHGARNSAYAAMPESNPYMEELYTEEDFAEDEVDSDEQDEVAQEVAEPAVPEQPVYAHLECPECQQHMRVPVGMGRVLVTCPSCGNKFESES